MALYPTLIANDTVTLSEPLGLLLLLGVLLMIERHRPVACGLLVGLLFLARPNAYLVAAIAGVALWRYVGIRKLVLFVLATAVVIVPWAIRNQVQIGTLRLATSEGFTLAAIYAPEAQRQHGFVDPVYSDVYTRSDIKLSQFDEGEWTARLSSYGLNALRENPGYLFEVVRRNVSTYFELRPARNEDAERFDGRNLSLRAWTVPLFYIVTVLGLAGLVLNWRRPSLWPAALIVVQFALLSFVLVAPPRLRAPFDLLMCIGLGLLAAALAERRGNTRAARETAVPVGDGTAGSPESGSGVG